MQYENRLLRLAINGPYENWRKAHKKLPLSPKNNILLARCWLAQNRTDLALPLLQEGLTKRDPYAAALAFAIGDQREQWLLLRPVSAQSTCDRIYRLLQHGQLKNARLLATQLNHSPLENNWRDLLDDIHHVQDWIQPSGLLLQRKNNLLPQWQLGWLSMAWWAASPPLQHPGRPLLNPMQQIAVLTALGANIRSWAERQWFANSQHPDLGIAISFHALHNPTCLDLGISIAYCMQLRFKESFLQALWIRLLAEKQRRRRVRELSIRSLKQSDIDTLSFLLLIDSLRVCGYHPQAKNLVTRAIKNPTLSSVAQRLLAQWQHYQGGMYTLQVEQSNCFYMDNPPSTSIQRPVK